MNVAPAVNTPKPLPSMPPTDDPSGWEKVPLVKVQLLMQGQHGWSEESANYSLKPGTAIRAEGFDDALKLAVEAFSRSSTSAQVILQTRQGATYAGQLTGMTPVHGTFRGVLGGAALTDAVMAVVFRNGWVDLRNGEPFRTSLADRIERGDLAGLEPAGHPVPIVPASPLTRVAGRAPGGGRIQHVHGVPIVPASPLV